MQLLGLKWLANGVLFGKMLGMEGKQPNVNVSPATQFYLKLLKMECLKKGHELSADEQIDFIRQAKMAVCLKTEDLHYFSKKILAN
jgi:hypothetical protein